MTDRTQLGMANGLVASDPFLSTRALLIIITTTYFLASVASTTKSKKLAFDAELMAKYTYE